MNRWVENALYVVGMGAIQSLVMYAARVAVGSTNPARETLALGFLLGMIIAVVAMIVNPKLRA